MDLGPLEHVLKRGQLDKSITYQFLTINRLRFHNQFNRHAFCQIASLDYLSDYCT